jgi:hypothetical protein
MLLQASTGISPCPPAKWPVSAKDGAVKSDHTLPLRRGEGLFPRLASAAQQGEGKGEGHECAERINAFAGEFRRSSRPAGRFIRLRLWSPSSWPSPRRQWPHFGEGITPRGMRRARRTVAAGSETRPTSPLPKIGNDFGERSGEGSLKRNPDRCFYRQAPAFVLARQRSGRSAPKTVRSKATTPLYIIRERLIEKRIGAW